MKFNKKLIPLIIILGLTVYSLILKDLTYVIFLLSVALFYAIAFIVPITVKGRIVLWAQRVPKFIHFIIKAFTVLIFITLPSFLLVNPHRFPNLNNALFITLIISSVIGFLSIILRMGFFKIKSSPETKEAIQNAIQKAIDNKAREINEQNNTLAAALKDEYLDDQSFIGKMFSSEYGPWRRYGVVLDSMSYGWEDIVSWAEYMNTADLVDISEITVGSIEVQGKDITEDYKKADGKIKDIPLLNTEHGALSVAGVSKAIQAPVKIVWYNQTRNLTLYTLVSDQKLMRKYVETLIRRTFGTEDAMKLAYPKLDPVKIEDQNIYINFAELFIWKLYNPLKNIYNFTAAMPLHEKEPVITLYEDGIKTREYCLQTEDDEDHTGKYFLISVRLDAGSTPSAQIDGFISDTPNERPITSNDIGYRMEGYYLFANSEAAKSRYNAMKGQDLIAKGLKYAGFTTPRNIRLVGICSECQKSFTFRGYSFYMAQSDVAYSDDGLDTCEIVVPKIDRDSWSYTTDGKTFRYYNSFCCPHCGAPYIDYKKHPENKVFGVSGCVHLGRKHYKAE